jgi:hypothetical protein
LPELDLVRLIRTVAADEIGHDPFGDGIAAAVEGNYCSVQGDADGVPTPGFFIVPGLNVIVGDHVFYRDASGYKVVLAVLNRDVLTAFPNGGGNAGHLPVTVGPGLDVTSDQLLSLDLSEITAGGELSGTLDAPTVDATHSGSSHDDAQAAAEATAAAALAGHTADTTAAHAASAIAFTPNGSIAATDVQAAIQEVRDEASGGAPSTADYLVGTASGSLSAEIPVGTTPGGELGGTWASPTVDTVHSGSAHHSPVTVGTGLDVTGQLVELDLSEVTAGGELGGFMDAPTVDASHGGGSHAATQAAAEATAASALTTHADSIESLLGHDLREWGATTGSSDNQTAIQAAIDDCVANDWTLLIPEGTFITSALSKTNVTAKALRMIGVGRTKSIIKTKAGTGDLLTLSGPFVSSVFRDFSLDGTGGIGHGFYFASTSGSDWLYWAQFENMQFLNSAKIGLYVKLGFSNSYVNLYASGNGYDQYKIWAGSGDHYERIDIGQANAGYSGFRSIGGGTFLNFNGIYDAGVADGPMIRVGGDGTAESDSKTAYPRFNMLGGNVEAFTGIGIHLVQTPLGAAFIKGTNVSVAVTAVNAVFVQIDNSSGQDPLVIEQVKYSTSPVSWKNGYPIHTGTPVIYPGGYYDTVGVRKQYQDGVGVYESHGVRFGANYANVPETYLWRAAQLQGFTDIAYLAHYRMGAPHSTNNYHDVTAAAAMPSSGTWRIGDIVWNTSHVLANVLKGVSGQRYILMGWRRLTDGSAHVLDTDWAEMHMPVDPVKGYGRHTFSNAAVTVAATDVLVMQIGTMSASRTATLPAASAVPVGWEVIIGDASGTATSSNTIVIARAGSDTINGATSETIAAAYGWRRLVSDGVSAWSFDGGILRTGGTDVPVTDGGTGSSTAAGARTNLGAVATINGGLEDANAVGSTGSTETIALTTGNVQTFTVDANCVFTMPSGLTSGKAISFTAILTDSGGPRNITFTGVKWHAGTEPTAMSAASAIDIFSFLTIDGGTTWYGFIGGLSMAT